MIDKEYREVKIMPAKFTVFFDGTVSAETLTTDINYTRITGMAVNVLCPSDEDIKKIGLGKLNIKIGGKFLFAQALELSLFQFNLACPVNERYFNYIDEPINRSMVEILYTPFPGLYPIEETVVNVHFQCE